MFENAHIEVDLITTERQFHARDYVAETSLAGQYYAVVICGGDGILHEVVNAMQKKAPEERVPIGLLPGGSSDGMAVSVLTESGL